MAHNELLQRWAWSSRLHSSLGNEEKRWDEGQEKMEKFGEPASEDRFPKKNFRSSWHRWRWFTRSSVTRIGTGRADNSLFLPVELNCEVFVSLFSDCNYNSNFSILFLRQNIEFRLSIVDSYPFLAPAHLSLLLFAASSNTYRPGGVCIGLCSRVQVWRKERGDGGVSKKVEDFMV